jgi:hypothetical protein
VRGYPAAVGAEWSRVEWVRARVGRSVDECVGAWVRGCDAGMLDGGAADKAASEGTRLSRCCYVVGTQRVNVNVNVRRDKKQLAIRVLLRACAGRVESRRRGCASCLLVMRT